MSLYQVQVTETYTPEAERPWSTSRRVLAVESGPCLAPVLVRLGRLRPRPTMLGRLRAALGRLLRVEVNR